MSDYPQPSFIYSYFECAANLVVAYIAASTSTLSWLSKPRRIAWWTFCLSGIIPATAPRVRSAKALATGSLECKTLYTLLKNSSTFKILSKCFSLCWHTRNTHKRRKLFPIRKTSANFRNEEFISIGNGYFSNSLGNLTIASHCSPTLPDLRPVKYIFVNFIVYKSSSRLRFISLIFTLV